jgi:putative nucleotidyltransferase with HDIG domain
MNPPEVYQVLLVDDEERVIEGLSRNLRGSEFAVTMANSGAQGLEILATKPIDIVISDLRMPGMDGNDFLAEVCRLYPRIIRFILSGHAEKKLILQTMGVTHQLLAKPCEQGALKTAIRRSLNLRQLLESEKIRTVVSKIKTLPSLPGLFLKLQQLTNDPETSMDEITDVIRQDIPMSAKILQVANSAFFNSGDEVTDLFDAIRNMGIETIKSLVLVAKIFSQYEESACPCHSVEALWGHSSEVASLARKIAQQINPQKAFSEICYTAGLLHDVGKLVFAQGDTDAYCKCLDEAQKSHRLVCEIEHELFGVAHPEVGAYLLGLWGLPTSLVEAVSFHHYPMQASQTEISPLLVVHLAEYLAHVQSGQELVREEPCTEYLKKAGVESDPKYWVQNFIKNKKI